MAGDFSIDTGEKRTLGTVDYVLFVLVFVASSSIGFYHAYKDRHKTSVVDFHLSGRKMHPIPVSLSLAATFMSALTLLGNPTEIYTNGTMFYWILVGMLIATVSSAHVFVPFFYNMNKTSCFEYIQMRFGSVTKSIASVIFLAQTLLYMGFVLYAPSLAFEAVTGLSLWGSMVGVAFVCTLYTTLGGMKTVLWTDTLQMVIMVAGLICVLVEASKITEGFANAWNIAYDNGRIELLNVSLDPRTRHSIWTLAIGGGIHWTYLYGVNQAQVQRACSLPTLKRAQVAIWMNFPCLIVIVSLTCMIGVSMFAFYKDCDPVKIGLINKPDQMLPLMVLDALGTIPGLTGLFVACVFSGSLSTMSSGLNAMSAVILEDFVKPFFCRALQGKKEIILSKVFVVIIGCVQFGMAFIISQVSGLILQLSYSMFSIMAGPLLGLFVSGLIFPWTNKYGASVGMIISLAVMCWLSLGTVVNKTSGLKTPLPTSISGCYGNTTENRVTAFSTDSTFTTPIDKHNISTFYFNTTNEITVVEDEESILSDFYRMSYMWYTGFGMLVNVSVALFVSFLTGPTQPKDIDCTLIIPFFYNILPFLPEKYRKWFKFGVVFTETSKKSSTFVKDVETDGYYNVAFVSEDTHM